MIALEKLGILSTKGWFHLFFPIGFSYTDTSSVKITSYTSMKLTVKEKLLLVSKFTGKLKNPLGLGENPMIFKTHFTP